MSDLYHNFMTITEIVRNNNIATFSFYRQGYLYYNVTVDGQLYLFPVEVADLGTATVSQTEKAITLMRYIRKALDSGSFVRA